LVFAQEEGKEERRKGGKEERKQNKQNKDNHDLPKTMGIILSDLEKKRKIMTTLRRKESQAHFAIGTLNFSKACKMGPQIFEARFCGTSMSKHSTIGPS
jgi:hypothetical protein